MKKLNACFIFLIALFSGCAQLENFADKNPVVVNIIVQESIVHYIDKGQTLELKKIRASQAKNVLSKVKFVVDSGKVTTVSEILIFANSQIDWTNLSVADQLLVRDIFLLINAKFASESDLVDPNTIIKVNGIINTAISATELF